MQTRKHASAGKQQWRSEDVTTALAGNGIMLGVKDKIYCCCLFL